MCVNTLNVLNTKAAICPVPFPERFYKAITGLFRSRCPEPWLATRNNCCFSLEGWVVGRLAPLFKLF